MRNGGCGTLQEGHKLPTRCRASHADVLGALSPPIPLAPTVGGCEVGGRPVQIVVTSLQFFQVLVVDQPLAPEVLEKSKVGPARLERLAALRMFGGDVIHPHVPGGPPAVGTVLEIAQWALHRRGRILEQKVAQAVLFPLVLVVGDVRAAQEPEGALIQRGPALVQRALEHAVVLLQQRHTWELAGQPRADGGLGGRGVGEVVERGRVGRRVGGVVDAGGRHGRAVAAD